MAWTGVIWSAKATTGQRKDKGAMTVTAPEVSKRGTELPQDSVGPEPQSSREELLRGAGEGRGKSGSSFSWVQELQNSTDSNLPGLSPFSFAQRSREIMGSQDGTAPGSCKAILVCAPENGKP